jgi:hypothetical protein
LVVPAIAPFMVCPVVSRQGNHGNSEPGGPVLPGFGRRNHSLPGFPISTDHAGASPGAICAYLLIGAMGRMGFPSSKQ